MLRNASWRRRFRALMRCQQQQAAMWRKHPNRPTDAWREATQPFLQLLMSFYYFILAWFMTLKGTVQLHWLISPSGTLSICSQKLWIGKGSSWNERAELRGEESLQTKEQHPRLVHRWFKQSCANALYKLPWGGKDSPDSAFWVSEIVKMLDLKSELFMRLLWMFRPTFLGHYWMPSRKLVSKHRRPSRLAYLPCTLADLAYSQFGGSEIVLTIHCFEIFWVCCNMKAQVWPILDQGWDVIGIAKILAIDISTDTNKNHPGFQLVSLFVWPALLGDLSICDSFSGKETTAPRTGSGKTLGFLVPAYRWMWSTSSSGVRTLILAPTRELATQIHDEATLPDNVGLWYDSLMIHL